MCHLVSRRFLPFLLSLFALLTISHVAYCQTEPELDASAQSVRVQMTASKEDLTLTLLLAQPIDKATHAAARISLLNAQDVVRAQLDQNVAIRRGQTRLVVRLTKPFAAVPPQEMQDLQWLRVKYEVKSVDGIVLASGIEALLAPATDPFMLTAAASRVAFPGFPYRAQVHVKSHDGHPLAGVQITGSLVWDDETADEKKIDAKAISSSGGDATLEFSIPKEVDAESADLAIAAKNGLVARSFEKSVDFRARSYLLLDTDKDIYQPGQTLHVRALRFGPDRKALAKETLDLRIEDEDQTLVFKESFITDDYGVAHLDWPTPATLQQGSYSIHVGVGGEEDSWRNAHADKSIRIYRYDLPNFRVEVKPDKPYYLSGQNADLAVSAEYLFGKPVIHGKVRVVEEDNRHWNFRKQQWEAVEKRVETGDLDRDGHFTTHFDLSKNHADLKEEEEYKQFEDLDLAAYVTDLTTGRTEQRRFQLRVTRDPIHVYVSPGVFRNSKMPPSWFVSTFYADGTPARCRLRLIVSNDDDDSPQKLELQNAQTNKYGLAKIAELAIPKLGDSDQLIVEAKDAKGLTGRYTAEIYGDDSAWGTVEVATSHAILRSGDPIEVTVRSTRPNLRLMVQAIRDGVVLASQNVKLRNGRGAVTFPYDARFTDEIGIFAFSLEEEWDSEVMLESERTVLYPKNRQLAIDVHLDKDEHRPGEDASARFHLASSDKSAVEGALGIKVVDRAVEERARTDADFGQHSSGWWSWSLWSSGDSSFGGVTRQDLDQIDLSQPVPSDLDLVAEYILQSGFDDLEILEDQSPLSAGQAFSVFLQKQFERLDTGLRQWNEQGKWVRTFDDLQAVGKESGVDVKELRDPWGMPYRFALSFQGAVQIVTVTSAGPDKKFDTADDFQAHRTQHQFFFHYGKLIESATHDVMANEGRFIRDRDSLQAELLKRGLDFNALLDPWGVPYETRFTTVGPYYVTEIVSSGEHPARKNDSGTSLWTDRVDYFIKSRENINRILTAHLNRGGAYPTTEAEFKDLLRNAGVDLDQLRDPWGRQYYVSFQKIAQYNDRIRIQQTSASGTRLSEPVTLVRQNVRVLSLGADGQPDTPDDFVVSDYSILVSQQSAKDAGPQLAPARMNLAAGTGAIMGIVVDASGAVIQNATVEATLENVGEKHSANTNGAGDFVIKDLRPGVYDITAHASGFRALEVKAVLVQASNLTQVSFELSVGTTTETVEVSASAVQMETTSAMVEVQGRNAFNYVELKPGMANVATKSGTGTMSTPRVRQDFPETMLWEPALVTDRHGHAKLNFKLADNITTWKLTAVGSTKNGELGHAEKDLRAFQPFFVEHDPPRILTQGDDISYPLVLRNYLDKPQTLKASMKPEPWFTLLGPAEAPVKVEPGDAAHAVFRYKAVSAVTNGKQQVSAANSETSDAAQKPVDVHPFGLPLSVTAADVIDQRGSLTVRVAPETILGSLRARVKVYPNLLAHVVENLEAGLEQPHGCGEQTISSTYPSLLVAQIFAKNNPKPTVALKAQRYLVAGYERLLGYQAESGGFSYWGHGEAADLALSAYALEFLDQASSLITVNESVMNAAEQFVLKQQGPDGAWRSQWDRNDKDALLSTAYLAQMLSTLKKADEETNHSRQVSLERALSFLSAHRDLIDEPYIIASVALAANASPNTTLHSDLLDWLRRNVHTQDNAAYWMLERNTPFYGWGRTGELESTALALQVLAGNANPSESDRVLIRKGLLFLLRNQDKDGMWFCGQTTVHVLKTLLALVSLRKEEGTGRLTVRVNSKPEKFVELPPAGTVAAPIEVDLSDLVLPGDNQIDLESTTQAMMSAQLIADSYVPWTGDSIVSQPAANATSALKFSVSYSNTKPSTSDSIECRVHAERVGYRGYGMMLGEVGLPPGADVDRESLEQALHGNYSLNRYDVLPDRVILYIWPQAGGSEFSFRFRPRFGMSAETAPSILYDYYNPDSSVTLKPTHFEVTP